MLGLFFLMSEMKVSIESASNPVLLFLPDHLIVLQMLPGRCRFWIGCRCVGPCRSGGTGSGLSPLTMDMLESLMIAILLKVQALAIAV
jgi:hypothetical protein